MTRIQSNYAGVVVDIDRIIELESGGDPNAVNDKYGARGLCQITRKTWDSLETKSKSILREAKQCYDDTIDWGAHPNKKSVFLNLEVSKGSSGY